MLLRGFTTTVTVVLIIKWTIFVYYNSFYLLWGWGVTRSYKLDSAFINILYDMYMLGEISVIGPV